MWRKVLTPTLLVIMIWIGLGCVTTFYIQWLAQLQDRVLKENVGTIQAVAEMQSILLRMQTLIVSHGRLHASDLARRMDPLLSAFEQALAAADKTTVTPAEDAVAAVLRKQFSDHTVLLREWTQRQPPSGAAGETLGPEICDSLERVTSSLQALLDINEHLLSESEATAQFYTWFHSLRLLIMALGPALGIACGIWIARGFRHSIARISVTLSNTETGVSQPLGLVTVTPADDLPALQHQVEAVGASIRTVVDQLQQARQQLVRSERLAAVGQLAAGVAHELRNPLTSVNLLIETAARRGPTPSLSEKQLWVIQEEIARMDNTIQGLLDFARPPALDRNRHDLRETVQRAASLVEGRAKQQQVAMHLDLPEYAVVIDADHAQIHQVFVNLLLNGIEAAGHGGVLQVAVLAEEVEHGNCRVVFRDSGKGILESVLQRVFEPFVTTKEHGTGLGLAVSRRIVEEHGGNILAENRAEGGAEFTVVLPMCVVPPECPTRPHSSLPPAAQA